MRTEKTYFSTRARRTYDRQLVRQTTLTEQSGVPIIPVLLEDIHLVWRRRRPVKAWRDDFRVSHYLKQLGPVVIEVYGVARLESLIENYYTDLNKYIWNDGNQGEETSSLV